VNGNRRWARIGISGGISLGGPLSIRGFDHPLARDDFGFGKAALLANQEGW
jgi:hypothetical protein